MDPRSLWAPQRCPALGTYSKGQCGTCQDIYSQIQSELPRKVQVLLLAMFAPFLPSVLISWCSEKAYHAQYFRKKVNSLFPPRNSSHWARVWGWVSWDVKSKVFLKLPLRRTEISPSLALSRLGWSTGQLLRLWNSSFLFCKMVLNNKNFPQGFKGNKGSPGRANTWFVLWFINMKH